MTGDADPHTRKAEYTPPRPDQAACPHCAAPVASLAADTAGLETSCVFWQCPACGQQWGEIRRRGTCTRIWTPGLGIKQAAP
jgi:hypothetical protein